MDIVYHEKTCSCLECRIKRAQKEKEEQDKVNARRRIDGAADFVSAVKVCRCGNKNRANANFCQKCGAKLA